MRWELFASHIAMLLDELQGQVAQSGESVHLTSSYYWIVALATAALDALLIGLMLWRIKRMGFRGLQPALLPVAATGRRKRSRIAGG